MAECMAEFTKKLLGAGADSTKEAEGEPVDKESLPSMAESAAPAAKGKVKKSCAGCKPKRRLFRR